MANRTNDFFPPLQRWDESGYAEIFPADVGQRLQSMPTVPAPETPAGLENYATNKAGRHALRQDSMPAPERSAIMQGLHDRWQTLLNQAGDMDIGDFGSWARAQLAERTKALANIGEPQSYNSASSGSRTIFPAENYDRLPAGHDALSNATTDKIKQLAPHIRKYGEEYGIPPIAIAAAIGDEFNTRSSLTYPLLKQSIDHTQDQLLPFDRQLIYGRDYVNQELEDGYLQLVKSDPDNTKRSLWQRTSNSAAGDFGPGNISFRTAKDLYLKYPEKFPAEATKLDNVGLLQYLVSDQGTAQFAALNMYSDMQKLYQMNVGAERWSPELRSALLVDAFKKGDSFLKKIVNAVAENRTPAPEFGRRIFAERNILNGALRK